MPVSSARSVRGPASNATSAVTDLVPGTVRRTSGSPVASVSCSSGITVAQSSDGHGYPRRLRAGAVRAVVSLACATIVAALAPASAQAAKGMEVAVFDDPVFLAKHYYDRDRALQNARELGVTRMRVFVNW